MALTMTEPVFLRNEYTGAVVRDPLGTPIVIGEAPIRPSLSYMGTPPMSYTSLGPSVYPTATPMVAGPPLYATPTPPVLHHASSYGYGYRHPGPGCCGGPGCCVGGLAGVGCCICCDDCCRDCGWGCQDCCYGCYY